MSAHEKQDADSCAAPCSADLPADRAVDAIHKQMLEVTLAETPGSAPGISEILVTLAKCIKALEGIDGGNYPGNNWPYENVRRWCEYALPEARDLRRRYHRLRDALLPNEKGQPRRPKTRKRDWPIRT